MGRCVRNRARSEAVRRDWNRKIESQNGSARGLSFKRGKHLVVRGVVVVLVLVFVAAHQNAR